MSEEKHLFQEFESISDESLREKVIQDLKGKDFEETLVWEDECGIKHQPYYRASDLDKLNDLDEIQACQKKQSNWNVLQSFSIQEENVKSKIQNALDFGVDQVILREVNSLDEILDVLGKKYKGKAAVKAQLINLPTDHLLKHFYVDPIAEELKNGEKPQENDEHLLKLFQERLNQLEPDPFLLVDGSIYKMAGANIVQEMALCLQHALSYFDQLTEASFKAEAVARSLEFKLSFGTSYFPEIAKARAFRYLVHKLYAAYQIEEEVSIWGEGSLHYLSHLDPYTNLLRACSMSMAAVLGNCNKVSTPAFDQVGVPSALGIRMAKNIQLILKEESYLGHVQDIASGSYYIESLTHQLANAAWNKFLEYEERGGLQAIIQKGELQKELSATFEKRKQSYNNGKTLLGVNKYPNPEGTQVEIHHQKMNQVLPKRFLASEIEKA
tara:strand:+ start:4074 stop:5393 length:1320 start_codon:yes stop_codon:yes gene_type:complete